MILWIRGFKCDLCGYKWLRDVKKTGLPSQCGRCKSRYWHKDGVDSTAEPENRRVRMPADESLDVKTSRSIPFDESPLTSDSGDSGESANDDRYTIDRSESQE